MYCERSKPFRDEPIMSRPSSSSLLLTSSLSAKARSARRWFLSLLELKDIGLENSARECGWDGSGVESSAYEF
jgi:hypothetical protein